MGMDEELAETKIIHCSHCHAEVDIFGLPPYTVITCPYCGGLFHSSTRIASYDILAQLGVGGMSLVYKAQDKTLGREIALKVLNQNYCRDPHRVKHMESEARVMARISHPNVVMVYAVGKDDDVIYIAMELIEGTNLEALINSRKSLAEKESLEFALQIAKGLRAGANEGVLHRDMKPANVLINKEGEAQIVDFGLALLAGEVSDEEEIWVTPHYATPEALMAQPEDVRSDIYSFGATIYHALSGKTSIEKISNSIHELVEWKKDIIPLGCHAPYLQEKTCSIIDKCLRFSPEERYANYDELINDLTDALASCEDAERVTWTMKQRRLRQAQWTRRGVMALSVFVLLGVVTLIIVARHNSSDNSDGLIAVPLAGDATDVPVAEEKTISESENIRQEQRKMGELFFAAREAFMAGKYSEAQHLFAQVSANKFAPPESALLAGVDVYFSYLMENNEEEGLVFLDSLLTGLGEAPSQAGDNYGYIYQLVKKLVAGEEVSLEMAIKGNSTVPAFPLMIGISLWNSAEWQKSTPYFSWFVKNVTPQDPWARMLNRLAVYLEQEALLCTELKQFAGIKSEEWATLLAKTKKISPQSGAVAQHRYDELVALATEKFNVLKSEEDEFKQTVVARLSAPEWLGTKKLLEMRQFGKAEKQLEYAQVHGQELNREFYASLAELSRLAKCFYEDTGFYLLGSKTVLTLPLAEDKPMVIVGVEKGMLRGRDRKGVRWISWEEVSPKALVSLAVSQKKEFSSKMKNWDESLFLNQVTAYALLTGQLETLYREMPEAKKAKPIDEWDAFFEHLKKMKFTP